MKKLMLILVVAMAVPAMAMVNFSAEVVDGNLVISYTTTDGDLPRGIALRVEGATADPANPGTLDPAFNTFVDYAFSNPLNFQVGDGHALADPAAAGVLAAAADVFSISAGVLDPTGNQAAGPAECTLITLPITCGEGAITISADTLRGPDSGVVGSVLESNLPIVVEDCGPVPCVRAEDVAEWELVGMPQSWCTPHQCEGDADGAREGSPFTGYYQVGVNDLNALIAGWKNVNYVDPETTPWIAADFDRKQEGSPFTGYYRVGVNDLNILIGNWKNDANLVGGCDAQ